MVELFLVQDIKCSNFILSYSQDNVVAYIFTAHDFDREAAKSSMAALKFILYNAVRYSVPTELFNKELQQLGLPKDHSNQICIIYTEFYDKIKEAQFATTLSISQLGDIVLEPSGDPGYKHIHLVTNWEVTNGVVKDKMEHSLSIRNEDLTKLVSELEIARKLMVKYSSEPGGKSGRKL